MAGKSKPSDSLGFFLFWAAMNTLLVCAHCFGHDESSMVIPPLWKLLIHTLVIVTALTLAFSSRIQTAWTIMTSWMLLFVVLMLFE